MNMKTIWDWSTYKPTKACERAIAKAQTQLILKAKSKGLWENFGQKEVRKIKDKHDTIENWKTIQKFNEWCYNYEPKN